MCGLPEILIARCIAIASVRGGRLEAVHSGCGPTLARFTFIRASRMAGTDTRCIGDTAADMPGRSPGGQVVPPAAVNVQPTAREPCSSGSRGRSGAPLHGSADVLAGR